MQNKNFKLSVNCAKIVLIVLRKMHAFQSRETRYCRESRDFSRFAAMLLGSLKGYLNFIAVIES